MLISALSIMSIEFLQYVTHRGTLDIDDFIFNLAGIYLGIWVFGRIKKMIKIE
jgi:glycopeptide antibiotics resistance protein